MDTNVNQIQVEILASFFSITSEIYPQITLLCDKNLFNEPYRQAYERILQIQKRLEKDGGFVNTIILMLEFSKDPIEKNGIKLDGKWVRKHQLDILCADETWSYISELKEIRERERLTKELEEAKEKIIFGDEASTVRAQLLSQIASSSVRKDHYGSVNSQISDVLQRLTEDKSQQALISTGYSKLDKLIGGFRPGELWIIGGRPSMGKTTLGLNLAYHLSLKSRRVLFISGEMSLHQIVFKIVALGSGIEYAKLLNYDLSEKETKLIRSAKMKYSKFKEFFVRDDIGHIGDIATVVGELQPDVIFVDFIQHFGLPKSETRALQLSEALRQLKSLAMTTKSTMVVLSQVNRMSMTRNEKNPTLFDLKESGALEEQGDIVILLHFPWKFDASKSDSRLELRVEKNRHGPIGLVEIDFDLKSGRMTSYKANSR